MSMRQYIDIVEGRIDELFDSTGIEWTDNTHAEFNVGGEHYLAHFKQDSGGSHYYEFAFGADRPKAAFSRTDNIGTVGSEGPKVFGKALDCLETFILKNKPNGVEFIGKSDTKRDVLYSRMAQVLGKRLAKLGYTLSKREARGFNVDRSTFDVVAKRFILKRADKVREDIGKINTKEIDVDHSIKHFDMPVDLPRSQMKAAFAETKRQFVKMFKGQSKIKIYRGLIVKDDWMPTDKLGISWAYDSEGAMKGSGLKSFKNVANRDGKYSEGMGVILVGEVAISDVNWLTTIAVNSFHEEEMEIVVEEGAPIFVQKVVEADRAGFDEEYSVLATPNKYFKA
jgi:hypothetical protein